MEDDELKKLVSDIALNVSDVAKRLVELENKKSAITKAVKIIVEFAKIHKTGILRVGGIASIVLNIIQLFV